MLSMARLASLLIFCSLCLTSANAGVMSLALRSENDLENLKVGDRLTIEVVLEKRSVGNLVFMGATTQWTAGLLSDARNLSPGGIIVDSRDFIPGFPLDSSIDAQFVSGGLDRDISTDGAFYRFDLIASAPGSGLLTIGDRFADDLNFDSYFEGDIEVNQLEFRIAASAAVPEPESIACFVLLFGLVFGSRLGGSLRDISRVHLLQQARPYAWGGPGGGRRGRCLAATLSGTGPPVIFRLEDLRRLTVGAVGDG